jgi:hypothetical protein
MGRLVIAAALLCVAGCQSDRGSLLYPKPGRADDPRLTIAEQEQRGRERYGIVEDSGLSPKTFIDRPGTTGR